MTIETHTCAACGHTFVLRYERGRSSQFTVIEDAITCTEDGWVCGDCRADHESECTSCQATIAEDYAVDHAVMAWKEDR